MMYELCKELNIDIITHNDYYLYEPGTIKVSSTNKAYTKYTPFYNKVKSISIEQPIINIKYKFY